MPDQLRDFVLPAVRGVQARREYFISMVPMRLVPELFTIEGEKLGPEMRAQRRLNRGRLPEMARYMTSGRDRYTFSAITASVDAELRFVPVSSEGEPGRRLGLLHFPRTARFVINDGQHRRAAIEMALKEDPSIGDECIGVVLFMDQGLERSQQVFADLNRYAVRTTRSLSILYDQRDGLARATKLFVLRSDLFKDLVDLERSTLSPRARRLLTLSAVYHATVTLLRGRTDWSIEEMATRAQEYWHEVARHLPEWRAVQEGRMTGREVRRDYLHPHGISLQALGEVGSVLLSLPGTWQGRLRGLRSLDWRRSNSALWEGRAMVGGRVSKAGNLVILTGNAIKRHLGLELKPEEQRVEDAYLRGHRG
jgi:DNA sulfur modification protein DndB